MSTLEARYRRALRWYPRDWREANGDALVGTLLDAAEAEGRSEPTPAELRDLRWRGLDQRGLEVVPAPARERAGALAVGVGGMLAVLHLVFVEWAPWAPMGPDPYRMPTTMFGPFTSAAVVLDLLWVVALAAALAGARWIVRGALLLELAGTIAIICLPSGPWVDGRPQLTVLLATAALALPAILATPSRRSRSVTWIGIAAGVTLAGIAAATLIWHRVLPIEGNLTPSLLNRYWIGRAFYAGVDPVWYGVGLLILAIALSLARRRWWAGAIVIGLGPWWIGMEASALAADRHSEVVWAFLFALLYLAGFAVRAAGYRWRRGNGIRVGP